MYDFCQSSLGSTFQSLCIFVFPGQSEAPPSHRLLFPLETLFQLQNRGPDRELPSHQETHARGQAQRSSQPDVRPHRGQEIPRPGGHPQHRRLRVAHLSQLRVRSEEHRCHGGAHSGRPQETREAGQPGVHRHSRSLHGT